ncbi:hypothetical protein [Porticoccus sp.]
MKLNFDTISVSPLKRVTTISEKTKRAVFRVQVGDRSFDLYIDSPSLSAPVGLEAAIPLALLPAMRLSKAIHVNGPVSITFLEGVKRVIDHYAQSFDEFSVVPITADSYYHAELGPSTRKASFFSGGVDSFYTLLKGRGDLTDIITIRGFDISLGDHPRWEKTRQSAQAVANELGVQFHEVESNFGVILKEFGSWVLHGHGLALASVARALANNFVEIRIPGSFSASAQIPWGSSAFTDPEYSDERLAIIHDTCDATRAAKTVFLANEPTALKYLRVCPGVKNDGNYNCCRCEKCLRTMVALYSVDALSQAPAFPLPLTPRLVSKALVLLKDAKMFTDENIQLIQNYRPEDKAMLRALRIQQLRPIWAANIQHKLMRKRRHMIQNLKKIKKHIFNFFGHVTRDNKL